MANKEDIREFLNKKNIFAVIGASENPEKYGHKVYIDLKNSGFKVYPVNPNSSSVDGDKCYPDLKSLPEKPDVVNIVVPPNIAMDIIKQADILKIDKVWLQPGAESGEAISYCKNNHIRVIHDLCIMVEKSGFGL